MVISNCCGFFLFSMAKACRGPKTMLRPVVDGLLNVAIILLENALDGNAKIRKRSTIRALRDDMIGF